MKAVSGQTEIDKSESSLPLEAISLARDQQILLLDLAREAIACYLSGNTLTAAETTDPDMLRPAGVFVTLRTIPDAAEIMYPAEDEHPDGRLRGCVGRLQADLPLIRAVQEMAVKSATRDPRFPPMRIEELAQTRIEISVLSPPALVSDIRQIVIGRHGLIIESGYHRGVLLPKVAVTRGWNREQFVAYTCMKAGLESSSWPGDATLYAFQALDFSEEES